MTTNELIDLFKAKFHMGTDNEVAQSLDIDAHQLGHWRSGQWPMPLGVKLRISDHLGFDWVKDSIQQWINPIEHARLMALDMTRLHRVGY
jgi:hypothetical protein